MLPKTDLIHMGVKLAGSLASTLIDMIVSGQDIEPILSTLPSEGQKDARRILEDAKTLQALKEVRDGLLGQNK